MRRHEVPGFCRERVARVQGGAVFRERLPACSRRMYGRRRSCGGRRGPEPYSDHFKERCANLVGLAAFGDKRETVIKTILTGMPETLTDDSLTTTHWGVPTGH